MKNVFTDIIWEIKNKNQLKRTKKMKINDPYKAIALVYNPGKNGSNLEVLLCAFSKVSTAKGDAIKIVDKL